MKRGKYLFKVFIIIVLFILTEVIKNDSFVTISNDIELAFKDDISSSEVIDNLRHEYNNNDIVGTIEILNTDFKEVVVQGNDNDYYLRRSPSKLYDINGSIFLDYRTDINGRKLIIYGHNDAYLKMPFDILENYYDVDYLNSHKYVRIVTYDEIRTYEIFSLYIETKDFSYMDTDFTLDGYGEHIDYLKSKSMYKINTSVSLDDNILVLQTCSTHKDYQKYSKKFLILVFKEIQF